MAWSASAAYPTDVWAQACVESGGYIYCVGGLTGPDTVKNDVSAVYYATLSSSGVGQWASTTSYPVPVWTQSCAASASGIYCVGGISPTQSFLSSVYYAPFSSSGLGQWVSTTSYPVGVRQQSCVTTSSDLFCVGGYGSTDVYFAPLTSPGVGAWTKTTGYPFTVSVNSASCVTLVGDIYCVGGFTGPNISNAVNHASFSPSGVGQWVNATNYPIGIWGGSCVTSGDGIFCVGGEADSGIVDTVAFSFLS